MIYSYADTDTPSVIEGWIEDYDEILIDFFAPWCGPCKAVSKPLESIHEETGIDVLKINADTYPEIARHFNVRSVPTIFIYKDGVLKHAFAGLVTESVLMNAVENL